MFSYTNITFTYYHYCHKYQTLVSCMSSHCYATYMWLKVSKSHVCSITTCGGNLSEINASLICLSKCSLFVWTHDLQRNTSRQTKPLRVEVMHSSVVAHQCFALKALTWLGQVIRYSGQFLHLSLTFFLFPPLLWILSFQALLEKPMFCKAKFFSI